MTMSWPRIFPHLYSIMSISLARRCLAFSALLIAVTVPPHALAAPILPTAASTSLPNLNKAVLFTGWMSYPRPLRTNADKVMWCTAAKRR